jgi:hypothetical protein
MAYKNKREFLWSKKKREREKVLFGRQREREKQTDRQRDRALRGAVVLRGCKNSIA